MQVWSACNRPDFWVTALLAPLIIYLVFAGVDLIRKYALEKPLMRWLDPLWDRVDRWLTRGGEAKDSLQ